MYASRPWNYLPSRQTISKIVWRRNEEATPSCVVSKSFDERFGIQHGKKVSFSKVECYVDQFIEQEVPSFIDKLYNYCNELQQAFSLDNDPAVKLSDMLEEEIKVMMDKLNEIDKLQNVIHSNDQDDFDLRIIPARHKINSAVEYYFEICNNHASDLSETSQSATSISSRSNKAKDLLSFLPTDEISLKHDGDFSDSDPDNIHAYSKMQTMDHNEKDDFEAIEQLNKDVDGLHVVMKELHSLVNDQGEVVDSIEDHIENAGNHIEEGNKKLKKATIAKAAMFPLVGAVIGGAVGGPIGLVAGMKIGSLTGGVAMAGVAGTVAGYQSGKYLKKKKQVEM